ncbi:hypothetical protein EG68_08818 [Paragonimus skrjabini miyazakii]|uniref:Uncharacterized protein n=1 Tax=Paragonimus skrjabini miyazakii TaxID=59628 RepID=A0A8S9YDR3_9TREM|nr:hypothetical protein EG68_08818 [Paragonimus skrjabini miyazakii]
MMSFGFLRKLRNIVLIGVLMCASVQFVGLNYLKTFWSNSHGPRWIHVAVVVVGDIDFQQSVGMLKSLLYQRGQFHFNRPECQPEPDVTPDQEQCISSRSGLSHPMIEMHLMSDEITDDRWKQLLKTWKPEGIRFSFYPSELVYHRLASIPNKNLAGILGLQKIFIPEVLPKRVSKVILLDTDVLFNHDIADLWKLLEQFDANQFFGGAPEDDPEMSWDFQKYDIPIVVSLLIDVQSCT